MRDFFLILFFLNVPMKVARVHVHSRWGKSAASVAQP